PIDLPVVQSGVSPLPARRGDFRGVGSAQRGSFPRPTPFTLLRWNFLMKLGEIAAALGCRLEGDGEIEISGVAGMEHAGPGHLTFLANPKYAPKVKQTKAAAILVSEPLAGAPIACLVSQNPYLDFARALALFY